jgi:hypothetical protein
MRVKPREGATVYDPITQLPIEGEIDLDSVPVARQIALIRYVNDGSLVEVVAAPKKEVKQ